MSYNGSIEIAKTDTENGEMPKSRLSKHVQFTLLVNMHGNNLN